MSTITAERNGYKRLNFETLNFADDAEINKETMENITPIHWKKEALTGEKQVKFQRIKGNI